MTHPRGNVLINVRQQPDHWIADVYIRRRYVGSRFVLCSQGLSQHITDQEIQEIVLTNSPQQAADLLIALANERGGTENVTVIVLT